MGTRDIGNVCSNSTAVAVSLLCVDSPKLSDSNKLFDWLIDLFIDLFINLLIDLSVH